MSGVVPLPMGDLFRPYKFDDNGNIVERENTVSPAETALSGIAHRSPDAAAILMAELEATKAALDAKK